MTSRWSKVPPPSFFSARIVDREPPFENARPPRRQVRASERQPVTAAEERIPDMPEKVYVGIDVSKEKLDVCVEGAEEFQIRNRAGPIRQMLQRLAGKHGDIHVCFESTGVYGRMLLECCHERKTPASVLNAGRIRHWARGCGYLAKTDRIDARMLCSYGRKEAPRATEPPEPWKRKLQDLRDMRDVYAGEKLRLAGRLEQAFSKPLVKMLRAEIGRLERKLAGLDAAMARLFKAHDAALPARLTSVQGVGEATACLLVAAVPELGTLGGKTAAALCGVSPNPEQSGKLKGPGHIGGGRAHARRALYMPAVGCIRNNPILGAFYRRKRAEGRPARVAIVAVMRKLAVLLERIASDPGFTPASAPEQPLPSPSSSSPLHPLLSPS